MKNNLYPSWCCQKCGSGIGWLGRFINFITFGKWHRCGGSK